MLDAIKNRHSIRFMRKEPIDDSIIQEIINAGFHAPSAHNNKGWHAYFTRNDEVLTNLSQMHSWSKSIRNSSCVVAVCYDTKDLEEFWIEDCSAFMENMLLQATELNIGNWWIGVRGVVLNNCDVEKKVREIMNIPDNIKILGLCVLGKIAKDINFSKKINVEERIHEV